MEIAEDPVSAINILVRKSFMLPLPAEGYQVLSLIVQIITVYGFLDTINVLRECWKLGGWEQEKISIALDQNPLKKNKQQKNPKSLSPSLSCSFLP